MATGSMMKLMPTKKTFAPTRVHVCIRVAHLSMGLYSFDLLFFGCHLLFAFPVALAKTSALFQDGPFHIFSPHLF